MSEQVQEKDSNELLNVILIVIGLLFIFMAVVQFLYEFGIWGTGISAEVRDALAGALGGSPYVAVLLGIWALISGFGMFGEEEWALGQAMVVLTIMAVSSIATMIQDAALLEWWVWLIDIAAALLGIVGFLWLVATAKRYD